MRLPASAEVADAAARYITGRQCRDGGFCFDRTAELEEPNLADTWFALSGLRWLGAPVPRADAVVRWLDGSDAQALRDEVLHHWARSLQWLHSPAGGPMPARWCWVRRCGVCYGAEGRTAGLRATTQA